MADVKTLIHDGFKTIGTDVWARCCRHVKDNETQFWREDIAPSQKAQAPVIIETNGSDSEETDTVDESTDTAEGTDTESAAASETDTALGSETETAGSTTDTALSSADDC